MGWVGGGVGAGAGVAVWWIARMSAQNLPGTSRELMPLALGLFTVLVGFVVGATIGQRVTRYPRGIALFSTVAGGVGGAVLGAATALAITAAYLTSYGAWPEDTLGRVLFVLAFPAFGGIGWFAGAAAGSIAGLTGGTVLRLLGAARR